MNCELTTEYFPWLLNGTLEDREAKEVRDHLAGCASCRQALTDTRRAWEIFDQHIPTATLVAYAADTAGEDLDGFDPAILEEHLATCAECAAELELVRMSRSLSEDERIAILAPRPPRAPAAAATVRPVSTAGNRWRRAAFAAGLAGVIALGGWYKSAERAHTLASRMAMAPPPSVPLQAPPPAQSAADAERIASLQHQVEEMTKTVGELQAAQSQAREQLAQVEKLGERQSAGGPQLNPWVGDVRMSADVVRGGSSSAKEVPAGSTATLLLAADTTATGDRDVEISDAGGKTVWKGNGLRATPQGDYSLLLPKGWLPAGDYTIHLYRQTGGQRAAAESYAIRVK
ncbi:MAG TPA: zf-HC2 domain-containing protein [Thermoanaerobaculia bacterium]